MILHYFLIGIKDAFSHGIFRIAVIIIILVTAIIIYRRFTITLQSGSAFRSPYKIANGFFYIHSGIVPGNRKIRLNDINQVTIHLLRGRHGGGHRYHIRLETKNGRGKAFLLGKSGRTEAEIAEMRKLLNKNKIKVHYYDYTKR